MSTEDRSKSIAVLYARGTHFEVGFEIGRTFQINIESVIAKNAHLNDVLVVKYQSAKVRRLYEFTLQNVTKLYPQYVEELRGIANGARVPFFKESQI